MTPTADIFPVFSELTLSGCEPRPVVELSRFVALKRMLMGLPLVVAPAFPADATMHTPEMAKELTAPAHVIVTPVTDVAAVPVLVRVMSSAAPATLQVGEAAVFVDSRSAATRF